LLQMARTLQKLIQRRDWVYAAGLGILAALPRLYRLDLAEFKHDEAKHYRTIYLLTQGAWRWVGAGSSQTTLPKPPFFTYTLAAPMLLSRDPRVVIGFLGVLAALAAGGFYLILRRFMGRKAAFSAVLLFALNPQAVFYARKIFTADLLPPLCTLFLAAGVILLESSQKRAGRLAAFVTFAFALLALTTFSPLMLLPVLALLLLERGRDIKPLHWLGASAALILPFVPYLIAVTPHITTALPGSGGTSPPKSVLILLSWIWELLYGSSWPTSLLSIPGVVAICLVTLSLTGLIFLVSKARKKKEGRWSRFFLTWLCVCPFLTLLVPVKIHPHYFTVLYPLLFALPAAGVELAARKSRVLGWVALLLLCITAAWQIQTWGQAIQAAAAGSEGYGTPLGYWWRAAEQARALAEREDAAEVLLLMPGDNRWDEKGNNLDALLSDTPHRVVDGHTTIVYPPHPAILLIASEVEASTALALPCTQDLEADLPASPLGGTYHYRLWSPAHADADLCTQTLTPTTAQWASGVRLLGYDVAGTAQPGETLHVTLYWETTQGSLDADVHWFNQLEDQAGQRWGQFDTVGWPAARWQPGDRVLVHFDLSIAPEASPGPYVLRVGQYTYPEIENIPVVDVAGNPADYAVTLPVPAQ
jgi:hypothetical protein